MEMDSIQYINHQQPKVKHSTIMSAIFELKIISGKKDCMLK